MFDLCLTYLYIFTQRTELMASVKLILRKKANIEGKQPIAIQIIKDRKASQIFTGYYVFEKEWDAKNQKVKRSTPNSARFNNLLQKKLAEVQAKLIEAELENTEHSSSSIKNEVRGQKSKYSFFALADTYLSNLKKSKKFNQLSSVKPTINHFKRFLGHKDISVKEISVSLLKNYKAYLVDTRGVSDRTLMNNLVTIRTLLNMACSDNPALKKHYPFGSGKIEIRFPETLKVGLSSDELHELEKLSLTTESAEWHAKQIWLFAYYFAGMRMSDVLQLKWTDLRDNRLYYLMKKNSKANSIKIGSKASTVLSHYTKTENPSGYIFPYLQDRDLSTSAKLSKEIANAIKRINRALRKVAKEMNLDKPLSCHIARHTFGNISGELISPQMLQKLYRHSSLSTTIGYQQNFIHKSADEALESIVGK